MTVGHVMSDPRTTQIEYTFSSLVSVFSHIVYVWLDRLLAISTWRYQFADRQVLFRTDCLPVVHGINKGRSSSSSSEWQNAVYRFINRICHKHNIFLHAQHIKCTDNVLSDFVSRNMEQEFLQQCLQEGRTVKRAQVLPVTLQPSLNIPAISFPSA